MQQQLLRNAVAKFWDMHSCRGKSFTVKHFLLEGYPRPTVYRVLNTYVKCGCVLRKHGSGGHNKVLSNSQKGAIARWSVDHKAVSMRKQANKYGVHEKTIRNVLKEKGIKCYKRSKAPMYTHEQAARTRKRAGKLLPILRDKVVIMDDECYFKLKGDSLPGNDHFYSRDKTKTATDVKFCTQRKFPPQLMVWICVSESAVGEPVFLDRPNSVTAVFYQEECIRAKLTEFIAANHASDEYIFWPDLASAHTAKNTVKLLEELQIPTVSKDHNPPNLPQCRPIENFWGILKQKVYENGWEAENTAQLKRRITRTLQTMDTSFLRRDFASVRTRLRVVYREGPHAVI
jgi:transposase